MKKVLKVGLTGGIGSGKTTVATIFKQFKIPVYNSDERAKFLMNNDADLVRKIKYHFGDKSYTEGVLNREYLATLIFNDTSKRLLINSLVHPVVSDDFNTWIESHKNAPFVIKEAAILIETEGYKQLDKLIVVVAPEPIRIERVMQRDNATYQEVKARIKSQITDEERIKHADYTIINDNQNTLIKQVKTIYDNLTLTTNN